MDEKTAKLIEQLANKLGTTTEYLWMVMIKQAPIDATITLIQILIVIVFGFVLYKLHKKFIKKESDERYATCYYDNNDYISVVMGVLAFFWLVLIIACFFAIGDIVNGYFNPEYWALNNILKSL